MEDNLTFFKLEDYLKLFKLEDNHFSNRKITLHFSNFKITCNFSNWKTVYNFSNWKTTSHFSCKATQHLTMCVCITQEILYQISVPDLWADFLVLSPNIWRQVLQYKVQRQRLVYTSPVHKFYWAKQSRCTSATSMMYHNFFILEYDLTFFKMEDDLQTSIIFCNAWGHVVFDQNRLQDSCIE